MIQDLQLLTSGSNADSTIHFVSYNAKITGDFDATTLELFGALQNAYNDFRKHLFNNRLSKVVLTLNRDSHSWGYYQHRGWVKEGSINRPEINNPFGLYRESKIVMSTLVHEMVHHQQYQFGKPGRGRYRNKQFAQLMIAVGLVCSSTGRPEGKQTGDRMSHYLDDAGAFAKVFAAMPKEYLLPFKPYYHDSQRALPNRTASGAADNSKTKFTCTNCGNAAWGKPSLNIICGDCNPAAY